MTCNLHHHAKFTPLVLSNITCCVFSVPRIDQKLISRGKMAMEASHFKSKINSFGKKCFFRRINTDIFFMHLRITGCDLWTNNFFFCAKLHFMCM